MAREWGSIRGAMFLCILVFVSCAVMSEAQELGKTEISAVFPRASVSVGPRSSRSLHP